MDENKNINPSGEETSETDAVEIQETEEASAETADEVKPEEKKSGKDDALKAKKKEEKKLARELKAEHRKKMKNQALFKRGGYSLIITAVALAALIVFNVLVAALSKRFNLEFDMSAQKTNTISSENVDYIKAVDKPVTVTVCATEDNYVGGYMAYYAQNLYNAAGDNAADYYKQTVKLIKKYADFNDNISVRFVDTQDTAFTEITSKYSNEKLSYGDIIVSCESGSGDAAVNRYKIISFDDIYSLSDESGYAAQGYGTYTVSGNNIETALTSAVVYATSSESKKVAVITGHSTSDYTSTYLSTLETNNYEVVTVGDALITSIPDDCDMIAIVAPNKDFLGSELDMISEFLDNDGDLSRGLVFFADASSPYLKNLYDFLGQWGISVGEGLLFETNESNHMADDPTTMGIYPSDDDITSGMSYCIAGLNVPLEAAYDSEGGITVKSLMTTSDSVVNAPVGTPKDWTGAGDYTKAMYSGIIQAKKTDYNDDNEEISSFVIAFGSVEYIYSQWTDYSQLSNMNIALAATERATGASDNGISFVSKTITNESFASSVTASGTMVIRVIFMILVPLLTIAAGIYIFIRRKNA